MNRKMLWATVGLSFFSNSVAMLYTVFIAVNWFIIVLAALSLIPMWYSVNKLVNNA